MEPQVESAQADLERGDVDCDDEGGLHMRIAPTANIDEVDEMDAILARQSTPLLPLVGVVSQTPRPASYTAGVGLVHAASARALHRSATCTSRVDMARGRYRGAATRKQRRRAVFKNGECNVLKSRMQHRRLRYLQDLFTTFVDSQWRWTLLVFGLSFVLSWLLFAAVWWLIAFTHGDLDVAHQSDDSWMPCVVQIHDFTSCFLFSIETQHTIGYGSRSTTEECPEAIFVMCLQSICGVMIQAFMVGIVFAKMTRPKRRTQTLLFSRHAVVCQRDGALCLMFRVGDMRKSHIIGTAVRAQLIRSRTTKEGEVLPQCQTELSVGTDGGGTGDLFFIWPLTIVHKIDRSSPFFRYSAADLVERDGRLEVVVILEGTIESTGQTTQARSSYLPSEILWGHRFEPMVEYNKDRQGYEVDYSRFNNTYQVDTPLCSAKELAEFYKLPDDHSPHAEGGSPRPCLSSIGSPCSSPRPPSRQRHTPDGSRLHPSST